MARLACHATVPAGMTLRHAMAVKYAVVAASPSPLPSVRVAAARRLTPALPRAAAENGGSGDDEIPEEQVVAELKRKLFQTMFPSASGSSSGYSEAAIVELVTELESRYPTPVPTDALPLLNGKWILVYTKSLRFLPLGPSELKFREIKQIYQIIDSETRTAQNGITLSTRDDPTDLDQHKRMFQIKSKKDLKVEVVNGKIRIPELTDSLILRDKKGNVTLDMDIFTTVKKYISSALHIDNDDLPTKSVITSAENVLSKLGEAISSHLPLKIDSKSGLLTTYLDQDLMISRNEADNFFVFIKENKKNVVN